MRLSYVVGIIVASALVLSLAAPALLASREVARKSLCCWNLTEIGTSLGKYSDQNDSLPAIAKGPRLGMWIPLEGGSTDFDPATENWVMELVPYLPDNGIQGSFEQFDDPADSRRYAVVIPLFRCPSDNYNRSDNLYISTYSRGNYAIDAGSNDICVWPGDRSHICPNGARLHQDRASGNRVWYGDGVAGYNKSFRIDEFPNGLAHMVSVEEVRAGIHELDSRGTWALGMVGSSVTHQHGLYGDAGSPNRSTPNADDIYGCHETTEALGREWLIDEKMPCAAHLFRPRQATARSMHPGGVHCLMLDGSCHFVTDDVSVDVWHVMHSRENRQEFVAPWD
jgi:hypothetical protein